MLGRITILNAAAIGIGRNEGRLLSAFRCLTSSVGVCWVPSSRELSGRAVGRIGVFLTQAVDNLQAIATITEQYLQLAAAMDGILSTLEWGLSLFLT